MVEDGMTQVAVRRPIRFRFAADKALAAIQMMLATHNRLDLHTVLKACYFADKEHLNLYDRPVFGASYRAMRFGPVPLEVYEMLKGESLWLSELGLDGYPWAMDGHHVRLIGNARPDMDCLSESDVECLEPALTKSVGMNFNERTAATHGPDWQAAELGMMRYEDMIDGDKRARLIPYLQETARYLAL